MSCTSRAPLVVWLSLGLGAFSGVAHSEQTPIARGDLLLVRGRLRDCPDHPRLLVVVRLAGEPIPLLGLGTFAVVGKQPAQVRAELRARFHERIPERPIPPIEVEAGRPDARWEVELLRRSLEELACARFQPEPLKNPDRSPRRVWGRIASR